MKLRAALPVTLTGGGRPTVPLEVQGHVLHMLVSTAGRYSGIKASLAVAMGLPAVTSYPVLSTGLPPDLGTELLDDSAEFIVLKPSDTSFGQLNLRDMSFYRSPDRYYEAGADGVIGYDVLGPYDLEFDIAGRQLKLFSPEHCPGQVIYWTTEPFARIPLHDRNQVEVKLGGRTATAVLNTSERVSHIDIHLVQQIEAPGANDLPGLQETTPPSAPASFRTYHYHFSSLAMGGVTIQNPSIVVTYYREDLVKRPPLVLGADILTQLHLFFAFKEGYLYATAAGAR